MAGFNTDNTIQYVELRQSAAGQNLVGGHKIRFYDASNTLKAVFTFPTSATNPASGDSILIGTSEFNANTSGGDADFTFSMANTVASNGGDALHPVQAPGGKVVWADEAGDFNCNLNTALPADSLGYGSYTGTINYGTGPAPALPSPSDSRALRLGTLTLKPSNNASEYALAAVSTSTFSVPAGNLASDLSTPRNNGRTVLQLQSAVGGIAELPGIEPAPREQTPSSRGGWSPADLAAIAAGSVAALATIGWFVRRRRPRVRI